MKKIALLLTMMALVLTACGGKTDEAEKTHYYEILDGAGETLYTVQDQKRVEQIDELVNTAGMEISHAGSAEGDPFTSMSAGRRPPSTPERTWRRSGNIWRLFALRSGRTMTRSPRRW